MTVSWRQVTALQHCLPMSRQSQHNPMHTNSSPHPMHTKSLTSLTCNVPNVNNCCIIQSMFINTLWLHDKHKCGQCRIRQGCWVLSWQQGSRAVMRSPSKLPATLHGWAGSDVTTSCLAKTGKQTGPGDEVTPLEWQWGCAQRGMKRVGMACINAPSQGRLSCKSVGTPTLYRPERA